jgi:P4 family phage/plasmid primase-like protien
VSNVVDLGEFAVSLFKNAKDYPELEHLSWPEFKELIERSTLEVPHPGRHLKGKEWDAAKILLPMFSPARFDGHGKSKKNVIDVSMLVGDLDDAPKEIGIQVSELPWHKIIYETPSPAAEGCVRWRVVFPLTRPVLAEDWEHWWRSTLRDLGLTIPADPKCSDASRAYFLPSGGAGVWELPGAVLNPDEIGAKRVIKVGERNDRLFRVACSARARGLDVRAMLEAENARCAEPLDDEELERIAQSAERYQEGTQLDDIGNAARFAGRHAETARYASGLGWLAWDASRWKRDEGLAVVELAKETARSFHVDAAASESESRRAALTKHAKESAQKGRIDAMLSLARSVPEISIPSSRLDADPWLLNVRNGSIDLRTGILREHRRDDVCSKIAGCELGTGEPSLWLTFLERVVPDPEEREFLRRWVGYSLTGIVSEEALAFLHGDGANGKSTFLLTMQSILGDYFVKAGMGLLDSRKHQEHPAELMPLRGARFVWTSETDKTAVWNEARVKDLSSKDPVTARYMRENPVTWKPTHKLWVAGNHRPKIQGTDLGIWRRIRLVPFTETISDAEKIVNFEDLLRVEHPRILRWALDGCLAWQRLGLTPPKIVLDATAAYRAEEDIIGRFLAEECVVGSGRVEASRLYLRYQTWITQMGERTMSQTAFGKELRARGFDKVKTDGKISYVGLELAGQGKAVSLN